jgi:hypothetical protein
MNHRIGRNDPCPCGSGKKYKKCCLGSEDARQKESATWMDQEGMHVVGKGTEPAHIHIRSAEGECKFWLSPISLARNRGVPSHRIREIETIVYENQQFFPEKFNEYHGD